MVIIQVLELCESLGSKKYQIIARKRENGEKEAEN